MELQEDQWFHAAEKHRVELQSTYGKSYGWCLGKANTLDTPCPEGCPGWTKDHRWISGDSNSWSWEDSQRPTSDLCGKPTWWPQTTYSQPSTTTEEQQQSSTWIVLQSRLLWQETMAPGTISGEFVLAEMDEGVFALFTGQAEVDQSAEEFRSEWFSSHWRWQCPSRSVAARTDSGNFPRQTWPCEVSQGSHRIWGLCETSHCPLSAGGSPCRRWSLEWPRWHYWRDQWSGG